MLSLAVEVFHFDLSENERNCVRDFAQKNVFMKIMPSASNKEQNSPL